MGRIELHYRVTPYDGTPDAMLDLGTPGANILMAEILVHPGCWRAVLIAYDNKGASVAFQELVWG